MTTYDWYRIFSEPEFEASGLVSQLITPQLTDRGRLEFLLSKGNEVGVTYADQFLPVNFLGMNPYAKGGYAVYIDLAGGVWFGFEVLE